VTPYNANLTSGGVKVKVMGFFDFFENEYHVVLEGNRSSLFIDEEVLTNDNYVLYLGGEGEDDTITINLATSSLDTQFVYNVTGIESALDVLNGIDALVSANPNFTATVVASSPYPHIIIYPVGADLLVASTSIVNNGIESQHYSFNETRNGFCSFYDYHPEWATGANDMIYSWLEGVLYKHNNATNYCNFYGQQYDPYVTVVFNQNIYNKKSWNSLTEIANTIWAAPNMYTNTYSHGTTKQQSNLVDAEFTLLEANPTAAIKRDVNSPGGKLNGNYMKGNYLVVKLQKTNGNNLVNLSEVSCRFTESPLNIKS
jgi:hypothetical protein